MSAILRCSSAVCCVVLLAAAAQAQVLRQITDFGQRPTMICRQVSWSSDSRYIFAALMETDADIVLLGGALR